MNEGITKLSEALGLRGWVLYDGSCPSCLRCSQRFENALTRRGFDLAPLQSPWVAECFDLVLPDPPAEMLVITADGRVLGGVDGLLFLARFIWWAWPAYLLGLVPTLRQPLRRLYALVAAHRTCLGGSCAVHSVKAAARA